MTPRLQNCVVAHSAINTFIFLKKLRKKIIFCSKQHIGKAINSSKPLIKKKSQTFPKMWDAVCPSNPFPGYQARNTNYKAEVI